MKKIYFTLIDRETRNSNSWERSYGKGRWTFSSSFWLIQWHVASPKGTQTYLETVRGKVSQRAGQTSQAIPEWVGPWRALCPGKAGSPGIEMPAWRTSRGQNQGGQQIFQKQVGQAGRGATLREIPNGAQLYSGAFYLRFKSGLFNDSFKWLKSDKAIPGLSREVGALYQTFNIHV